MGGRARKRVLFVFRSQFSWAPAKKKARSLRRRVAMIGGRVGGTVLTVKCVLSNDGDIVGILPLVYIHIDARAAIIKGSAPLFFPGGSSFLGA